MIAGIGCTTVGLILLAGRWVLRRDLRSPAPAPAANVASGKPHGPLLGWDGCSIEQYYLRERDFS